MFKPYPFIKGGNLQSIASMYWPQSAFSPPHRQINQYIDTEDGDKIEVHSHILPENASSKDDILLVHGLGGSIESRYMTRMAMKGILCNYNVHRMNLRGCGESISYCKRPYHAGLWKDIELVLQKVKTGQKVFVCGFSLGGNMVLKMFGDLEAKFPSWIGGVAAVSPPLDLENTTRWIEKQKLYHNYFLKALMKRFLYRKSLFPEIYTGLATKQPLSIFEFDEVVTAPTHGFSGASDYYLNTSCGRKLSNIHIPTLIIYAEDDPVIPASDYKNYQQQLKNSNISLLYSKHGGHVAFIARGKVENRFWSDDRIFTFFEELRNVK